MNKQTKKEIEEYFDNLEEIERDNKFYKKMKIINRTDFFLSALIFLSIVICTSIGSVIGLLYWIALLLLFLLMNNNSKTNQNIIDRYNIYKNLRNAKKCQD